MFNIYYINYEKAFEISMLMNNRIQEQGATEKNLTGQVDGKGSIDTHNLAQIPFIEKIIPKSELNLSTSGSMTKKVVDHFRVVTTKSTILKSIYNKAIDSKKLNKNKIGTLVKIKNNFLKIDNQADILATKSLLSGFLDQATIEGVENVDIGKLFNVILKDSSYIISGEFNLETITFKIPMLVENEMESQYSITDLEIGPFTIIGIYRGVYKKNKIKNKLNRLDNLQKLSEINEVKIESEETNQSQIEFDGTDEETKNETHFIDIIAVIQELTLK